MSKVKKIIITAFIVAVLAIIAMIPIPLNRQVLQKKYPNF